jgi:hypothetical protein
MCIYGWQNYRLWLLAAEKLADREQLLNRARQILAEQAEPAEVAGAALFLGGAGDETDFLTLAQMLRSERQSISVRRALCISIQRLGDIDRAQIFADLAGTSATLAVLIQYLSKLPSPKYVARTRRVPLRQLRDEMPDSFS